jgi:hypothetical protein
MLTVLAAAVVVTVISGVRSAQGSKPAAPPVISRSAVTFHDSMRKLWEDHITWTRNVIISFEVNVPDSSETLPDLGAIKPYYGNAAGDELTSLLHDHIAIAGDILQDVKTGNSTKYQTDNARWYANAHDIAVFLSGGTVEGSTVTLNPPTGSLADWDQMMKDHLDATTAEVVARKTANWTGDVAAYDKVHQQALGMADMLSNGIIANFPAKFRP